MMIEYHPPWMYWGVFVVLGLLLIVVVSLLVAEYWGAAKMTEWETTPLTCKHCKRQTHPYYVAKYHGFCLDCANAGVPELRDALQFALDKVVCRTAGSSAKNEFAYLWTRDWREFEKMAREALGTKSEASCP